MFCATCGSQLAESVRFCSKCGTAVSTPSPPRATPSKAGLAIAIVAAGFFVVMFLGALSSNGSVQGARHRVGYLVEGSANAVSITIRNSSGGTEQHEVKVPYIDWFDVSGHPFVYLSAQKKDEFGEIHVSITVNGRVIQEARTSSPFGIATASGRAE